MNATTFCVNLIISIVVSAVVCASVGFLFEFFSTRKSKKALEKLSFSEPNHLTDINSQNIREEISNYFKQAAEMKAEYLTLEIFHDCSTSKLNLENSGKKTLLENIDTEKANAVARIIYSIMAFNPSKTHFPKKIQVGVIKYKYKPENVFKIVLVYSPIYNSENNKDIILNVGMSLTLKFFYSEQEYLDKMNLVTPLKLKDFVQI